MNTSEKSLLRGQFTRQRNSATSSPIGAIDCATSSQHPPIEPPSLLDLARNKLRNNHATSSENTTQQAPMGDANLVAAWRWQIVFRDGSVRLSAFVPSATWDEVLEIFPLATSGQKIPDDAD